MSEDDGDFRLRPGRSRDAGAGSGRKVQSLAAQVRKAAARSGRSRSASRSGKRAPSGGARGRGRNADLRMHRPANARRVTIMARVVRHKGARFRAAPMGRHLAYLKRDGVTCDGRDATMFDARSDATDSDTFASRCEDDRHHFRFIVSPEDAGQMGDLRAFTRELMDDMARDLGTRLDWVAVDHWNTDNPHIHVLVRGVDEQGADLVIDRDYIREGMRARAEERVTLELGVRSEQEMRSALEREVESDRWTSLDRRLQRIADEGLGVLDLRPGERNDPLPKFGPRSIPPAGSDRDLSGLLIGRAAKLERLGLADRTGPAQWTLRPGAQEALRDLAVRSDIIKTMHRAMSQAGERGGGIADPGSFALHGEAPSGMVIGRLVERGLHDELKGTAYALIDGADGRVHHVRFGDLEMTGDAQPGAIVELRSWEDAKGETRLSLATRSDLTLAEQVRAPGATWLDRQLIAREPAATGNGFGADIRNAMDERSRHLQGMGLAQKRGQGVLYAKDLIETLRVRELSAAADAISARTGLACNPAAPGEHVSGLYRERVTLASGRFAMIDDGLGFQLVPWRPALEQQLGKHVQGRMGPEGTVDWSLGRARGPGL